MNKKNEPVIDLFKKKMITIKTKEMFGYDIAEFSVSELNDEEGDFVVYTAILDISMEDRDYSVLLKREWEVSEALDLYNNKTILRFL